MVEKYFKYWELSYHFNECCAYKTINLVYHKDDFEKESDAQDDAIDDINNAKIVEEEEEHMTLL